MYQGYQRSHCKKTLVFNVIGQQAEYVGSATAIRKLTTSLPQVEWLTEGEGNPGNKEGRHNGAHETSLGTARSAQAQSGKPGTRSSEAARDAAALRGILVGEEDRQAWWRNPRETPKGGREVTKDDSLTVLFAGGGLAGLVTASTCHAKGMKVVLFEQASSYAPHSGPIHIHSKYMPRMLRNARKSRNSYSRSSFWFEV
jgi:hypothetical protein